MRSFNLTDSRRIEHIMHPATKLVISALEGLKEEWIGVSRAPSQALDIGCGSGLLSLVMADLWPNAHIIAGDISKLAIQEMQENVRANGFEGRIECIQAEGLEHQRIGQSAPYDLIVANILAKWHLKYLRDMAAALAPDGRIILSGIQPWQLQELEQAMPFAKLVISQRMEKDGWVGLILNC